MRTNTKLIIYLIGLAVLGFAYYPLKSTLSGWLFVSAAFIYLLILRLLAEHIHKRVVGKETMSDSDIYANDTYASGYVYFDSDLDGMAVLMKSARIKTSKYNETILKVDNYPELFRIYLFHSPVNGRSYFEIEMHGPIKKRVIMKWIDRITDLFKSNQIAYSITHYDAYEKPIKEYVYNRE